MSDGFFLLSSTNRNFSSCFDRPVTFTDEHERDPPLFSRLIIGRFIAQLWDRRLRRGAPIDGAHQAVQCGRFPAPTFSSSRKSAIYGVYFYRRVK